MPRVDVLRSSASSMLAGEHFDDSIGVHDMRKISVLATGCVLALAACSVAPSPSLAPTTSVVPTASIAPSREPSVAPTATESAVETPSPTVGQPVPTVEGLLAGLRNDLQGTCTDLQTDLPPVAVAGIACRPKSDVVARTRLYVFPDQQELMDAYMTRLTANGVVPYTNGGRCLVDQASEGGYVPGDGHPGITVNERGGCYRDANGDAHYAATLPPFVLVEVDGEVGDIAAVERWAWRGNRDQPGSPTVWRGSD